MGFIIFIYIMSIGYLGLATTNAPTDEPLPDLSSTCSGQVQIGLTQELETNTKHEKLPLKDFSNTVDVMMIAS